MATRKLVSDRNTLLGTITYPDWWEARRLEARDGYIRLAVNRPMDRLMLYSAEAMNECAMSSFAVARAYCRDYPDAVRLYDITPEEFEKQPWCSFSPSAAYVRSLIGKD